jgi:predicted O-methyltransferase YrrM
MGGEGTDVSGLLPPHEGRGRADDWLVDLALRLIPRSRLAPLLMLEQRGAPAWVSMWPGEHYRLLAGLMLELQPRRVVEIGTFTGLSAIAMIPFLPAGGELVTFDVIPWAAIPDTYLRREDFDDGRLRQILGDLGDRAVARHSVELPRDADLIFLDAAKDGRLEREILSRFEEVGLKPDALVVLDDIRVWNMLTTWRDIPRPKLDLTSFGHYSGTGLIHWTVPDA